MPDKKKIMPNKPRPNYQVWVIVILIGLIFGIGTYYLINRLGLNKKPYQLEQEKIEREKRERSTEQTLLPAIERSPNIN